MINFLLISQLGRIDDWIKVSITSFISSMIGERPLIAIKEAIIDLINNNLKKI